MNQKKTKLLLLFLAGMGISGLQAQDAATASGGDASGAGGSAAYSVGQVAYTSIETASGSVNQGVQQPYKVSAIGINTNPDIDLLMSVYPNPTVALINLSIQNMDLSNLSYQLYDVQGKLLVNQKVTNALTSVIMEEYAAGSYFLKVTEKNAELKSFKIIKN